MTQRHEPYTDDLITLTHAYYKLPGHVAGYSLHVVLDDENVSDGCVVFCLIEALGNEDPPGLVLGTLLLGLPLWKRFRIARTHMGDLGASRTWDEEWESFQLKYYGPSVVRSGPWQRSKKFIPMPQTDGGADFSLVRLDTYRPTCAVHGAMNKVTPTPPGFWRCLQGKCRAGCMEEER